MAYDGMIRQFEFARALLGHGGLMTPEDFQEIFQAGESRLGNNTGIVAPEWPEVVNRYLKRLGEYHREDLESGGVGISGPSSRMIGKETILGHRTCTGNTVLVANEHRMSGWSWTRKEIAGVQLSFGLPPEWLADFFGWRVTASPRIYEVPDPNNYPLIA